MEEEKMVIHLGMREPLVKAENIRTKKTRNYDKGND